MYHWSLLALPTLLLACHAPVHEGSPRTLPADTGISVVTVLSMDAVATTVLSNSAVLQVDLSSSSPVEGTCTLEDDFEEVHVVSSPDALAHAIPLFGLLAESRYHCLLSAGGTSAEADFLTTALPGGVPGNLLLSVDDGTSFGAYTLFNHLVGDRAVAPGRAVIVDREGRVRWAWEFGHFTVDVDASFVADPTLPGGGEVLLGGGFGLVPTLVGLNGEVRYTASTAVSGGVWHHHVEPVPSGTFYGLSAESTWSVVDPVFPFVGFSIEERDPSTDAVAWSWSSQLGVDQGAFPTDESEPLDLFHANHIIAENPADPGGVWVSLRDLSAIFRIEKATGEVTWRMGPYGGDFRLVDENGEDAPEEQWFYGQHAPELDGDHLYLYDNGTGRPGGSRSRVVAYAIDLSARTLRQVWEWTEEGWYESLWGDVDLLPNGHLLVTRGHCWDCDVESPAVTSWIELDLETGPVWRLDAPDVTHAGYRAERLEGCQVFANAKYCPELLGD